MLRLLHIVPFINNKSPLNRSDQRFVGKRFPPVTIFFTPRSSFLIYPVFLAPMILDQFPYILLMSSWYLSCKNLQNSVQLEEQTKRIFQITWSGRLFNFIAAVTRPLSGPHSSLVRHTAPGTCIFPLFNMFFSNWPFPFCPLPVTLLFRLLVRLLNRSPQTSQVSSACRGWIFPSTQHQSHLWTNIGFMKLAQEKRLQGAPPILTSLLEGEIRLADPRGDRLQGLSHRADYRNHVRSGCWESVLCFKQGILWKRLRFSIRLRWVCGHEVWVGWWVYFVESPYTQTFATTGHPFNTDSTLPRETYLVIVSIYSCQYDDDVDSLSELKLDQVLLPVDNLDNAKPVDLSDVASLEPSAKEN